MEAGMTLYSIASLQALMDTLATSLNPDDFSGIKIEAMVEVKNYNDHPVGRIEYDPNRKAYVFLPKETYELYSEEK